jgi:hypothetical protein
MSSIAHNFRRASHWFARRTFRIWERLLGLHVVPAHYYSPIPRTEELTREVFEKVYDCVGLDWNVREQKRWLEEVFPRYRDEWEPKPNPGLSLVDAMALYVMIRESRPSVMIEIGGGFSTLIALQAL